MPTDIADQTVHVVDDEDGFRDSTVRGFIFKGVKAVGYPTGEALLAQWSPNMRGVLMLDINMSTKGGMDGDKLFDRLLALGCHMPVVFNSGPHGRDLPKAVQLTARRHHVYYFGKHEPEADVEARIQQYLREELQLYQDATEERNLLQALLVDVPHYPTIALDANYRGITMRMLAEERGGSPAVWTIHLGTAWHKLASVSDNHNQLLTTIGALGKRMGARGDRDGRGFVVHLAGIELSRRLSLLDELQQRALHAALTGSSMSSATNEVQLALRLMSIPSVAKLRSLLKTAGQEMLGYVLSASSDSGIYLCEERHRYARFWLEWVANQPPERVGKRLANRIPFYALPDVAA